ncbi:MAG: DUF2309 family protein [Sphingomonadales bacterium]|nr:DUF2309 family protein [Sphingomonadales bacterium]
MNMMSAILAPEPTLSRAETAGLVAMAARTISPLWPLESAIAVNPLSGFEDLAFEQAVRRGATLFGARQTLPLGDWRRLLAAGRIAAPRLRDAAIRELGGLYAALTPVAAGVSALDLLMARLHDIPVEHAPKPAATPPDVAFLAKWCAAFFEQGVAASPMPHRALGLYRAVLALAPHDPAFHALAGEAGARLLLTAPRQPLDAIAEALAALKVRQGQEAAHLAALLARLPGWAGHVRWRSEHADPEAVRGAPAEMADLLALWLLLERAGALSPAAQAAPEADHTAALAAHFGLSGDALGQALAAGGSPFARIARMPEPALGAVFLQAAEWTYADAVVPRLQTRARNPGDSRAPDAQLVFCIDVRSEPFRRALEQEGEYETLGYAGFFGLPIALERPESRKCERRLPVLLAPRHAITEQPAPGHERSAAAVRAGEARDRQAAELFAAAKRGVATAFATAEATGLVAGAAMAARTATPGLFARIAARAKRRRAEVLVPASASPAAAFTLAEKIGYAALLFRLTGLSPQTARLVVLAGHAGSAVNNPYAAALACGACGGHAGGVNARLLATMLNEPEVRRGLAERGLALPETTVFVAGEHDTTTDIVTLFDRGRIPASHAHDLAALEAALARAGTANRARRAALLDRRPGDVLTGACHWGEVRPEWGLAGNAGFIVGPRWLSEGIDLEGRAFLHSYDWREDPDGSALATILTAPMVVAQWINCQYLFSTIDNQRYGAGDKVTHNVVGGIGVVQGNGGDLCVGLPRQSLFADDGTPFHVPQRLLAIVQAPRERVEAVVTAHDILGRLIGNGWVNLVVIDPETGRACRWRRDGEPLGEGSTPCAFELA